jgi:hypothetical protein
MKKLNLDLFKVILLVLLTWIAYSFYNFSNKDRYKSEMMGLSVFDTHTGTSYTLEKGVLKKTSEIPVWYKPKFKTK